MLRIFVAKAQIKQYHHGDYQQRNDCPPRMAKLVKLWKQSALLEETRLLLS